MKRSILFILIVLAFINLFAQTTETEHKASNDPLDVSIQKEQIEKYGVPTFPIVEEMKQKADALYEAKSWEQAAAAYEVYAKHVNWLANIVAQCLEPYYSASYDDKKNFPFTSLKAYIPYERKANELKKNRNEAYVKMGLCYKNLGDVKNAVTYLHKGLDLLNVDDIVYWNLARDALAEIIGFKID